jgi:hypothetical protein
MNTNSAWTGSGRQVTVSIYSALAEAAVVLDHHGSAQIMCRWSRGSDNSRFSMPASAGMTFADSKLSLVDPARPQVKIWCFHHVDQFLLAYFFLPSIVFPVDFCLAVLPS